MPSHPREPSRIPVRGTIGLVGTVGALAVLLSFRGSPTPIEAVGLPTEPGTRTADAGSDTPDPSATTAQLTVTGDAVATRWGDVQLSVTVDGNEIVDVVAISLPDDDRRSASLSGRVEATLREEAIASDGADVSVVSGATYTSRAYAASLQSALDQLDDATAPLTAGAAPLTARADAATPTAEEPAPVVASDGRVTITGQAVDTRWGTVQVAVTLSGDDIVDVEALDLPGGRGRSARISESVEPILREEAIASDGAEVSVVSGATYTSQAYVASLQSALDQLG